MATVPFLMADSGTDINDLLPVVTRPRSASGKRFLGDARRPGGRPLGHRINWPLSGSAAIHRSGIRAQGREAVVAPVALRPTGTWAMCGCSTPGRPAAFGKPP